MKKKTNQKTVAVKKPSVNENLKKPEVPSRQKKAVAKYTNHPNVIPWSQGQQMMQEFEKRKKLLNNVIFDIGIKFPKSLFVELLKLKDLDHVCFYNAINKRNEHTLVIAGIDKHLKPVFFKIKPMQSLSPNLAITKEIVISTGETNGVGDMGQQCSTMEPKYANLS